MMSDSDIFKIAAFIFFIGFSAMLISYLMKPKYIPLRKINDDVEGKFIRTSGNVKYAYSRNGITFITLENVSRINVVFFRRIRVEKGENVSICGKVSKYRGRLEIVGSKICKD